MTSPRPSSVTSAGNPSSISAGVVVGVDLGTTSTKAVAYDTAGQVLSSHSQGYPMLEPEPARAEQDPDAILEAVLDTVRAVAADCGGRVAALSFSTAMHSLLGLDAAGTPLTPSITWADSRAAEQAERLRADGTGLRLQQRTGTPVHPMSPLCKLIWMRERQPELARRVVHWVGIKEYVLLRLCGRLVTESSTASGTGLMDLQHLAWDDEALALAGIEAERLAELGPTTAVLPGLTPESARRLGLAQQTPVVVGAGDGPLANLGLGSVRPGMAAVSIGTSGALRVMVEKPSVDPRGGVFCYALVPGRWAVGGAVNNGGNVLGWAGSALAPELGEHPEDQLLDIAAQAPRGSDGLLMLPYLMGERAPHWSSLARGAYVGLTRDHGRPHLVRAALEGVCHQLALVLQSVQEAGNEVRSVRATGGFARSPLWRQMLADVLGTEVGFPAGHEGSSFGAALLGMEALGMVHSIDVAADLVRIDETVRPDPGAAAAYRAVQGTYGSLYDALVPTFRDLAQSPVGGASSSLVHASTR